VPCLARKKHACAAQSFSGRGQGPLCLQEELLRKHDIEGGSTTLAQHFSVEFLWLCVVCVCVFVCMCVCVCVGVCVWVCMFCACAGVLCFVFLFAFLCLGLCVACCACLHYLRSLLSTTGTWSVVDNNDLKK
jgi:hypothetical protein